MFVYLLSCAEDDEPEVEVHVISEKPLDLEKAVKDALRAMTYEDVCEPSQDWFETIVDQVCEMQGCKRVVPDGEYECSEAYWDEHHRKEEEHGEGEDDEE